MADKLQINSANVHGEPGTGLEERGDKGDFVCGNCEYFKNNSCGQDDMMKVSKHPRTKDNRVIVKPDWCCEYIERAARPEYGGKPKNLLKEPIR